jgi:PIN domain nuclease of toxin-antitoxin system
MEQYVIDTHPLLWYVSADARIGTQAKLVIEKAEAGELKIILPAIVLIEAIDILNKRRIIYNVDNLLQWIEQIPHYEVKNLDWDLITLFKNYTSPVPKDSLDKIIILTAQYFGNIPIITKDKDIRQTYSPTIW